MCGIVGYVGHQPSLPVLMAGLKRLEYRGYDSAGVAIVDEVGGIHTAKKAGKLQVLADQLTLQVLGEGHTGIAHTRWATHGGPTDLNAHPHLADGGRLALIHNGIIENYQALAETLRAEGVECISETDSEVAAHLVARAYRDTGDLTEALRRSVNLLHGAFTLLVTHQNNPGVVVGARRNSPLVVGLGKGENFLASDVSAFVEHTRRAVALGQDQVVTITPEGVSVIDFDGNAVQPDEFSVDWDASAAEKGGWSSFMAKEISEQPDAVANTLRGRITPEGHIDIPELAEVVAQIRINRVVFVACGTAAYAAMLGAYAMEKWAKIPTSVELS
ncbi:MAG: isomerizing glutamine--fructose-6-phosphate transaminase, partial [Pontimonas sp.]